VGLFASRIWQPSIAQKNRPLPGDRLERGANGDALPHQGGDVTGVPRASGADAGRRRRVLIADDHPLVRQGLKEVFGPDTGVEVCGEADDTASVWAELERVSPELVILDLSLEDRTGLELIKAIRARYPAIRVLVVSMHDETLYAEYALQAGASGYVQKLDLADALVGAVKDVLAGQVYLSAAMAERPVHRGESRSRHTRLSPIVNWKY
jgi:DNA-binding NarL/FixJ family response regulator